MNKKILMVGSLVFLLAACNTGSKKEEEPPHEHNVSSTWSSDSTDHWKTCSGCDEIFEKASHNFVETERTLREDKSCYDVKYACSVCNYEYSDTAEYTLTKDDILEKFAADKATAATKDAEIKKGEYSYFTGYGNPNTGKFEYAKYDDKDAFIHESTAYGNTTTSYVYYDGDKACGYKIDGTTNAVSSYSYAGPSANDFKGVNFTTGFFNPDFKSGIYGVTEIVNLAYDAVVANSNNDATISYENGTYTYSTGYIKTQTYGTTTMKYYYKTNGSVTFDSTTGIVTSFSSEYVQYYDSDITLDDEYGTFTVNEGVVKNASTFSYTAEAGTRDTVTLPYTYDDFKFTSFGLSYNGTAITAGSTIEVELTTTNFSVTLSSKSPATASADFDAFSFSVKDDATGEAVPNVYPSYSSYNGSFNLPAAVGKTYVITITTASGVSFSFKVKGKAPAATSITMGIINKSPYGDSIGNMPTKVYIGKPVYIGAMPNPNTADPNYTFVCKDPSDATLELTKSTYTTYNGTTYDCYYFDPTIAGTYTFTATCTETPTVSKTATVEVVEAPSLESVFTGNYYEVNMRGGGLMEKFTFTPNTDTPEVDGTLTVVFNPGSVGFEKTATYSYVAAEDNNGVTCTLVSGESNWGSLRFAINDDYSISAWVIYAGQTGTESQIGLYSTEQAKNMGFNVD